MKTYKNKYLALLFLCFAVFASSCRKYINETPIDAPSTQTFWTSEQAAQTGVAGAYTLLRNALFSQNNVPCFFTFGDVTAGEFSSYAGNYTYGSMNAASQFNFNSLPYAPSLFDWTNFYQVIAQCNLIISKVPGIPASGFTDDPAATKKQMIGEAYFIRGFCYYYMTEVWGQPVIVTQAYTDPSTAQPIARSTDAQGYAQAVSDLKTCANMLQYGYNNPSNVAVQANKGAAFAILSKVYMWQKQYGLAEAAADSVINNGGYQLETAANYNNIFKGHDPESIFEICMLDQNGDNEATIGAFNIFLQTPFIPYQASAWNVNKTLLNTLYDTTSTSADIRVKDNFYGLQSTTPLLVKYANVVTSSPTQDYVSNDAVVTRLADIYLTRAEAATRLGDVATGNADLNKIRNRAGLNDTTLMDPTQLIYAIMDERGREFFGEGSWYFDLFRTGLIVDPNYHGGTLVGGYTTPRYNAGGCHWPLNLTTLLPQDPLLTQNTWWAVQ